MNLKGRKESVVRYFKILHHSWLEVLRKITENGSHYILSPCKFMNLDASETKKGCQPLDDDVLCHRY
jgi:hypothetical protein